MGDESATRTVRESPSRAHRHEREEAVRKKYDFSVIRTLRQQKRLTIEQFAKLCGLSYAPISRIETNLIKPNLDTLDKIAGGLGISTGELVSLAERHEPRIMSLHELKTMPSVRHVEVDGIDIAYACAKRGEQWSSRDTDALAEHRCVVVRTGAIEVKVDGKTHRVEPGTALRFDRTMPHQVTAIEDAEVIFVAFGKR